MFVLVMIGLWISMVEAADTPVGRVLRYWCIETPAVWLNAIRSGQIALVVILLAGAGILFWAGGREALAVLQMGMPELAGWITTVEVATYLDVGLAIVLTATTLRFGMVRQLVCNATSRRSSRSRSPRVRRTTRAANDDAERGPFSLAA